MHGLEAVGGILWEYLNELHQFGPQEGSLPALELRAACRELQATAAYLQQMYDERLCGAPTPEEMSWLERAGGWAARLRAFAEEVSEPLPAGEE